MSATVSGPGRVLGTEHLPDGLPSQVHEQRIHRQAEHPNDQPCTSPKRNPAATTGRADSANTPAPHTLYSGANPSRYATAAVKVRAARIKARSRDGIT